MEKPSVTHCTQDLTKGRNITEITVVETLTNEPNKFTVLGSDNN
jgi:hypothetical protein